MEAIGWMNRKSRRNKYLSQSGTDAITDRKEEHKYSIFLKKISEGKNVFFAMLMQMPIAMTMLMSRFPYGLHKSTF